MQEKKTWECRYELCYELPGAVLVEECGQDGAKAEVEVERAEGCEWNLSLMFAFEQMPWDVSAEINSEELGVVSAFRSKAGAGNRYEDTDVPTMCVCERDTYADDDEGDEAEGEKFHGIFVDDGDLYESDEYDESRYELKGDEDVDPETSADQVKFISMLVDYAAKKMLKNQKVMKGLLAEVLTISKSQIRKITYLDTNTKKENVEDKLSILDLFIEMQDGVKVNIEIQATKYAYWENRAMVNLFRKFLEEIQKGNDYDDEHLPECVHIGVLNFKCRSEKVFHNEYGIVNLKTGEVFSNKVTFHLLELPKLADATEAEKSTKLYRWCRLFAAKTWEEYDQIAKGDESMEAAVLEMQEIFKSPEERNAYWRQRLYEMDQSTQTHAAERRGEERLNKLMAKLIEENRLDDLKRATDSKEWRDRLYKKYSL